MSKTTLVSEKIYSYAFNMKTNSNPYSAFVCLKCVLLRYAVKTLSIVWRSLLLSFVTILTMYNMANPESVAKYTLDSGRHFHSWDKTTVGLSVYISAQIQDTGLLPEDHSERKP